MKLFSILTVSLCLFLFSGCGYLLYPERQGQTSGELDAGVVILDSVGLLFGVLPGVVAFAVDFSNGTIFLAPDEQPISEQHGLNDPEAVQLHFNPAGGSDAVAEVLSDYVQAEVRSSQISWQAPEKP